MRANRKKTGDLGLLCSFCGIEQRRAKKLIAGPAVFICDECVGLCVDVLAEDKNGDVKGDTPEREIARLRAELFQAKSVNRVLAAAFSSIEFTINTHKKEVAEAAIGLEPMRRT